jgi:hypothetical protein
MPVIFERFEILGVNYVEIHFKVTPFARDLIIHRYRDGVEIDRAAYEEAGAEYRRLMKAAGR